MPNNKAKMEFFGDVALIKKLEGLQANVPRAVAGALKNLCRFRRMRCWHS